MTPEEDPMNQPNTDVAIDPACGMTVQLQVARTAGLSLEHGGTTYYFCGKGCLLEFRDHPETYLDPASVPLM
jgi:YHS domain-containing protein